MSTPDGFVKLKTVKYKRQFHTIYRSINEVQGDLKQMLEDEELEALQPCERDGSPAPDGVLKGKPIHFFITRKRCHFKLPSNLPFFGGEYEDDEEEEDLDDEDLDGLDESEDEEGVRTPPPSPAVPPQNLQGQQTPITPAVPQTPQRPIEQHPAQPPHTPHTAFLPGASLGPSTPLTAATPTIPTTPTPIAAPTATTPTTTTTTTTSSTPASQFVHSGQVSVNDKRAPAQNRELLLYVKINNNFYEIRGGLTTKCLGAKKEPEKEDNLIIGRWLWLTCVSNNNKTGVNFTMKCLLVIAGPNDQNIYLTSPEFVTLSTASSRKVTYLTQLTMKQPSELGEEEEDDEGDEEGEGMQIAYAAAAASPLPITGGGHTHTHSSLPPPPPVSAPPSAPAAVPMQMQQSMQHVMGGDAEGGLAFVVSAIQRSGDDMTFTTTSQLPQGAALVAPKAGKYALRKGKKVMYRKLSLEEAGGAGGGGQGGGEGSNTTSSSSGGGGGGMSMSDRKKGKKVKTFDEWLEELREFKNIHGHCQPKRKHFGKKETEQKKLAYWVERQRSNWKTGTLSEARKKRLDELGFIWPKKGKKRRSPNDKEEGDLTLSPSSSMDTTSSPPPPPRPAGKSAEGRKKQEQTPIGAEKPLAETTSTTPSRKASGLDSGNGSGNVDNKRRLDDEWMRLREERERMERERNQYTEQVKKEYEKKTWELLEKWKEEWRGLENGRRELEEKTKRLHNEQMRKENQKRKAIGGPESATAVAGQASAMGESATPLKKRKLGGGEGGSGGAGVVAGVVEGGGGATLLDKMVEDALGWEAAGLDDGEKESEKQEVSSTLSSMDTMTSTQGVVGGLGGFTSMAILQRLDEILANQKVILEALGRPQQQK